MTHLSGRRLRIGVLGPHQCSDDEYKMGLAVGREIARADAILMCGGLEGMMTAVAEGVKEESGLSIGVLPGDNADSANQAIDIALPTGLGVFRNMLLVRMCDAVIAVRGRYGTLSEIAVALRLKVPVVGLKTWELFRDGEKDTGIHTAQTPEEAVQKALELCGK